MEEKVKTEKQNIFYIVNTDGEVIGTTDRVPDRKVINENTRAFLKNKNRQFFWLECLPATPLMPELTPTLLTRTMVLGSYVNYNQTIGADGICTKAKLSKMLNITEGRAYQILRELSSKGIVETYQCSSVIKIKKYFMKGRVKKEQRSADCRIIKLYSLSVRSLILGSKNSLVYAAYIIRLLPYLNSNNNLLCNNVEEPLFNSCRPLTKKQISLLLQSNEKNPDILIDNLKKVVFFYDGREYPILIEEKVGRRTVYKINENFAQTTRKKM